MPTPEGRPPWIAVHEAWLPGEHPLHRPRHGGRQRVALIAAVAFFLTPVLALGVGVRPARFENRELADVPSATAGWRFFDDLPAWAADHLPFRDTAVRTADQISRSVFGETALTGRTPPTVQPVVPPPAVMSDAPLTAGYPMVIEGKEGWLYFGYDVEGKCAPIRPPDEVIDRLRRLRAVVEESGRSFVLVVPPDKSTAVPAQLPDSFAGRRCARERSEQFWPRITTQAGAIDLRPAIGELAVTGVQVYNRFDSHWTDAGSLPMVRAVAEAIQPGISQSWRVEPGSFRDYDADLPRLIGRTGTDRIQMYSLAPDGQRDRTVLYSGQMHSPVRFTSAPVNGMVTVPVAMVTDSFSLTASRYLAATFSDLTAVFYKTATSDVDTIADVMAGGNVVVFEVVERNLAGGLPTLLDDAAIDRIATVLKARPVR